MPRKANTRHREVVAEGGWVGHLSFLSVLVEKGGGPGGISYKLSVGGINVALLVRMGGGARGLDQCWWE